MQGLLGAVCATPPHLEGAPLSQVSVKNLTCDNDNSHEIDNENIMKQVNLMFGEIYENFTITNYSNNVSSLFLNKETELFNGLFVFLDQIHRLQFHRRKQFEFELDAKPQQVD